MLFITNPHLRRLEAFMQEIPNFPPKGMKFDFDKLEDEMLLFRIESIVVSFNSTENNLNEERSDTMKFGKQGITMKY